MPETFIVFQSPRSGKFVSDMSNFIQETLENIGEMFQSPRSGKFVSDTHSLWLYPQRSDFVSIP